MSLLKKLKTDKAGLPPRPAFKSVALAWLGAFLAIALTATMSDALAVSLVLGSFGATCVLVFGFPDVAFSQPRNVIAGHLVSSMSGLLFLSAFGAHWWAMAAAVATALALMLFLRVVHPPAGSNPVIIFMALPTWKFLIFPTLVGSILIVAVALIYNKYVRKINYPKYW
ncbi:MAG: HPP family protein [Methylophilaceae bacterium]